MYLNTTNHTIQTLFNVINLLIMCLVYAIKETNQQYLILNAEKYLSKFIIAQLLS